MSIKLGPKGHAVRRLEKVKNGASAVRVDYNPRRTVDSTAMLCIDAVSPTTFVVQWWHEEKKKGFGVVSVATRSGNTINLAPKYLHHISPYGALLQTVPFSDEEGDWMRHSHAELTETDAGLDRNVVWARRLLRGNNAGQPDWIPRSSSGSLRFVGILQGSPDKVAAIYNRAQYKPERRVS